MRATPLLLLLVACGPSLPEVSRPVDFVDTRMGSGGWGFAAGNAQPGAQVPNGLVLPGPDTTGPSGTLVFLHFDGYWAGDDTVQGFSQLHLSGTGACDLGVLSLMPTDAVDPARTTAEGYQSKFRKSTEVATPGFYGTRLTRGDIQVELTASTRVAFHRYTFGAGAQRGVVIIDLAHHVCNGAIEAAQLSVGADGSFHGQFLNKGAMSSRFGGFTVYFEGRLSKAPLSTKVWSDTSPFADGTTASGTGVGAMVELDVSDGAPVVAQLGLSFSSADEARQNLAAESTDFDSARAAAEAAWNQRLLAVKVAGGSDAERRTFYSALHHVFVMPNTSQDADGTYFGHDRQLHAADGFNYLGNLSLWDTYRTVHPLLHLLAPELGRDAVRSLLTMAQQDGAFPRWPFAAGEEGSMVGSSAEVVVADAWMRGVRDFDAEAAYALLRGAAMDLTAPPGGRGGRDEVEPYMQFGFVPAETGSGSASITCEYAVDDFALANLARGLGHLDDADALLARSQSYRHLYDDASGFLRARNSDGSLAHPTGFDALKMTDEYIEANAWHTTFCAPHDVAGTIDLLGGHDAFIAKLTDFFAKSKEEWESLAPDSLLRSLPRPYYWPGNEPDIHAGFMFAQAGRPDLTQQWVRWAADTFFSSAPDGLPGNDDGGAMSAWYVFSALGLYPLPGTDLYILGAPRFPKATLRVPGGSFVIDAPQASAENLYVQSVELNGKPLKVAQVRQADLKAGGSLVFHLGKAPSTWGRQ